MIKQKKEYYKGDIIEVLSWKNPKSEVGSRHHVIEQKGDRVSFWVDDYRMGLHKNMVRLYRGTFLNNLKRIF